MVLVWVMLQHIWQPVRRVQSAVMASNPYESPTPDASRHSTTATVLRYLIAIGCWFASLLLPLAYLLIAGRPEIVARRDDNLLLFVAIFGTMFGLPAIGLVLLGAASWRRSKWLALAGLIAFLPIILLTLAALLWPKK